MFPFYDFHDACVCVLKIVFEIVWLNYIRLFDAGFFFVMIKILEYAYNVFDKMLLRIYRWFWFFRYHGISFVIVICHVLLNC